MLHNWRVRVRSFTRLAITGLIVMTSIAVGTSASHVDADSPAAAPASSYVPVQP